MTVTILTIGLNTPLIDQLNVAHPSQVVTTESCDEAINVLRLWDILTIVMDSQASTDVKADVDKLLSATPITTRIILISESTDFMANEDFSGLGVTTLTSPVSSSELEPYFQQISAST